MSTETSGSHAKPLYQPVSGGADVGGIDNDNNNDNDSDVELNDLRTLLDTAFEIDNEEGEPSETGNSSMRMAFMNMANSILGAGIIGQPFAFRNAGLIGGILVMIVLAFLIDWTLRLIVINAHLSNTRSYQDTAYRCFGIKGKILLSLSISSFAYGGCMAFCVIIGDTIPHVLKAFIPESITGEDSPLHWLFHRNTIIVIFTTCISYPLSLNKDISKLAKASGFALIGMLIITIITIIRAPFVDNSLRKPLTKSDWTFNSRIFQAISVVSFALVCHHNTIYIYNSMRNASLSKFSKLTHIACVVSMICCATMGINGFVNFGSAVKGNVLNNFKSDDELVNIARFCFGLNMLTTFPLEIFVVRDVLKDAILSIKHGGGSTAHIDLTSKQHFFLTTGLVLTSMLVSLFTCNLGIILELIGATSASLMAYILPPMCYLKLSYDEQKTVKGLKKKDFILKRVLPSVACITFGFLIMFVSSFMSIRAGMKSNGDTHCVVD